MGSADHDMNDAKVGSSRLLSISQVQALTGVKKSTLRHWETEFRDFIDSERSNGNQRRFSDNAVDKIQKIRELVEDQGLTLKGVRQRLEKSLVDSKPPPSESDTKLSDNVQQFADLMSDHIMRRLFENQAKQQQEGS